MVSHSQMFFDKKKITLLQSSVLDATQFLLSFLFVNVLIYVRHYITQRIKQGKEFTDSVSISMSLIIYASVEGHQIAPFNTPSTIRATPRHNGMTSTGARCTGGMMGC